MGLKDAAAKNFFGRPDILAVLLDCLFFGGKRFLRKSRITDICGEHPRIVRAEGGGYKTDSSSRDKLFECEAEDEIVSIGLEFQARNDKKMIPRIMKYNSRLFSDLLSNNGTVHRVMNIVLSFDKNEECASNLLQLITVRKSKFNKYFFNYGYINLNIYDLAEKLDIFPCGELKDVLYLFKCAKENRPFMEDLAESRLKRMRRMSRDAAFVCAVFLGFELDINDDTEETDMCDEVRRFIRKCKKEGREEGRMEGREEGRMEGREEGRKETVIMIVKRLLQASFGILEICDYTGASEDAVRDIAMSMKS